MMYGLGSPMGGCGCPSDNVRFKVSDPTGGRSQFLGASGSRQTGYYHSPSSASTKQSGDGEWKQSGGGGWYKE